MDRSIAKTLEALRSRGINAFYAEDRQRANLEILDLLPEKVAVGIGDSTTVRQIGIIELLEGRDTKVFDGFYRGVPKASHDRMVRESTLCDVFLAGTNAVTIDGRLVNVDGAGNRVAGMFYGHRISVIVMGRNKLVDNLEEAFHRIRNIIAPNHLRIRSAVLHGPRLATPCVITGICNDCRSKDRMCNIFSIIEGKPVGVDLNVIIIDEDLGLGWDESWPKERRSKIVEEYQKYVWIPTS